MKNYKSFHWKLKIPHFHPILFKQHPRPLQPSLSNPNSQKVAVSKIALRSHQKRNQIQLPLFKNDNSALFQQKVNGIIWKTSTNGEYVCVCFFFFFNNLFIYFSLFWIYLGVLNHVNVNFILAIWSPTYMI